MSDDVEATRVALVTGCGKPLGIGAASARALGHQGVTVVVSDVELAGARNFNQEEDDTPGSWRGLPSLIEEINGDGGTASYVVGDVSAREDAQRMVAEVLERHGRLDILVNNAGAPQEPMEDIEHVQFSDWVRIIDINLTGTFLMCQAAVPAMRDQGWGRIINMSSVSGQRGRARRLGYSASKSGILGLTRALSLELAPVGITINAICPGEIFTTRSLSSVRRDSEDPEAEIRRRAARVPLGRHGTPDEVASMVAYLTSDAAAFVTGAAINVDGGSGNTRALR